MEMNGKIAVVTGGNSGIGKAIAAQLARRGAKTVLAARNEEKLESAAQEIQKLGGEALTVRTDVTNIDDVQRLIQAALERYERIDILVNNAGGSFGGGAVVDSDPDKWWETVRVNLQGPYLCSRAALPSMIQNRSGHIVNILSILSRITTAGGSAYCAAKAGALALTQILTAETKPHGIRVTGILPGAVDTPLWDMQGWSPERKDMLTADETAEAALFALTRPQGTAIEELTLNPIPNRAGPPR